MIRCSAQLSASSWLPLTSSTSVGQVAALSSMTLSRVSAPASIIFCRRESRSSAVPPVVVPLGVS